MLDLRESVGITALIYELTRQIFPVYEERGCIAGILTKVLPGCPINSQSGNVYILVHYSVGSPMNLEPISV